MRISDWSSDVCSSDLWPRRSNMPTGGWSHRMRFSSRHLGCVRDCRFMHNRRPDPVDDREQLIDAVPAAVAIADDLEAGTPQRLAEVGVVTELADMAGPLGAVGRTRVV